MLQSYFATQNCLQRIWEQEQNKAMNITLTVKEKYDLKKMHRKTKNRQDADKIKAVLMFSDGYAVTEIAEILLLDDDTVRTWLKAYEEKEDVDSWLEKSYLAYTGKLSKEEKSQVEAYVANNIISDSKKVKEYIEENFAITYSLSGITGLLKHLGFVYKKTILVPSKYDPVHQIQYKVSYEVLEQMLTEKEAIFFMDGVHPQHNTTCTSAWIKKGEPKEIKSNTGRQRVNWNGVYNPITQDILLHESDTINADAIIVMLKKIEEFYPEKEKIYGILDNAKYYRNKKVTEYLKTSRIEFRFLPPYSPNLNLIERVWKFMRKKVINDKYYEKFSEFKEALAQFAENLPNQRTELKQFIGTKMHLLSQVNRKPLSL
jgi:transposase